MKIYQTKEENIEEIAKLMEKLEKFYNVRLTLQQISKWKKEFLENLNSKNGGSFIAKENKKIIGYIYYYFINKKQGSLEKCVFVNELFIESKFRRKGVGTKLIKKILKIKFPKYVEKVVVTIDPKTKSAKYIYRKNNFVIVGKTKAGNILLEKEIKRSLK